MQTQFIPNQSSHTKTVDSKGCGMYVEKTGYHEGLRQGKADMGKVLDRDEDTIKSS
jgi:hypothetical protein